MGGSACQQEAQLEIFFGRGRDLGPEAGPNKIVCVGVERMRAHTCWERFRNHPSEFSP